MIALCSNRNIVLKAIYQWILFGIICLLLDRTETLHLDNNYYKSHRGNYGNFIKKISQDENEHHFFLESNNHPPQELNFFDMQKKLVSENPNDSSRLLAKRGYAMGDIDLLSKAAKSIPIMGRRNGNDGIGGNDDTRNVECDYIREGNLGDSSTIDLEIQCFPELANTILEQKNDI